MDIEAIREICKGFPKVTEDIKWGHDLVFAVGGKMFCVAGLDQVPVSVSFKVTEAEFDELSTRPNFRPAPYVAKYKWVLLEDAGAINAKQWQYYLAQSYELVKAKLPPKIKTELGF